MTPIRHYPSIDSTNLEAHQLFAGGERGPLFLLADEQTAGKGRLNRNWASARGNCYSTLMLPLNPSRLAEMTSETELLASTPQIGFVVALAVADVVCQHTSQQPQLKWPNDVLVGGAKIAGILCEVLSTSPLTVAIGCGINVAHAPTGLAYPATCLMAEGAKAGRDMVFDTYREALFRWLDLWDCGAGFAAVRGAWGTLAIGIGETATMATGTQQLTGTFEGITEQGAVMLKPPHGPAHILHAGDLHIPSLAKLRNGTP